MSPILVLVGLLVLSYAGTLLGGRTLRGAGLPSSVEFAVLGLALGPHALGVLTGDLVTTFEPLAQVALGWMALVVGLDFGRAGGKRARAAPMVIGFTGSAFTAASVGAAIWFFATRVRHVPPSVDLALVAGGVGASLAETTHHAVRWAIERHGAQGRLTGLLWDFAHADDLVPLLALAVLYSLAPVPLARVHVAAWGWVATTVGFGAALGAMTAMHLGRELRVDQTWGVLLGVSVLGVGVGARLGMSVMTVLFFMGWTTAALSRHRAALRAMVAPVERSVVLPALVLAGAHVDFFAAPWLPEVLAVAIGARVVAKALFGAAIAVPCKASPVLGVGLLSSGAISLGVGLAYALRFPGPIGESVLAASFVTCVVGEVLGPVVLRRVLRGVGEIVPGRSGSPSRGAEPLQEGAAP